ncbi:hypothetical protein [Actinoplanes couchii]|uniref:Lincosamide nucleotidyltransferase-like C-terminal domain-containing protein n=1 Tax=Actinoplanes couchii TaxID=403638 RepID=A0ABQ3XHC6_9ACTN|nr:hypothetical protein [Actinoplanes couchii]MDR6320704.1 lincosamide nucleotidyltransferase [Actinoplanes couchii]GID57810.1 hypothetical protein Aco03nite_062140 [Actinoplanes couchii]
MRQHRLIADVERICRADGRLAAALTYGSFAAGQGDVHSDIEFWLFFESPPDPYEWIRGVGPSHYVVGNEFGAHVAFFPGLIRGEFHFATAADIPSVGSWPARGAPVDRMIVVDRSGALRKALDQLPDQPRLPGTPDERAELCGRFANWLILAHHVTRRGEWLRAVDALTHVQRHLLWMARLAENRTQHWLTPSRAAETDLPPAVLHDLHLATATADPDSLRAALSAAWSTGRRYWPELAPVPTGLFAELDAAM